MPYAGFTCPFCGSEILNKEFVKTLTQTTCEHDSVGTSVMLVKCQACKRQTGILIASDRNAWLLLPVPPENLFEMHEALRALMKKGAPVATIAKHFEKILPAFKAG